MNSTLQITKRDKYGNITLKVTRIRKGLYHYTDYKGRLWIFEQRPHDNNLWWCGTENDAGADQYHTLWECKTNTAKFLNEGH
jgi:hypothetical protein